MGFPIFPLNWVDPHSGELAKGFRESGYLPEALINFLAFLGWNPGTEQELFSMDELIDAFSIERIGKAGARFDIQKAQWFNQQYLKATSNEELAVYLLNSLQSENIACSTEKAAKICEVMKERVTFTHDFWLQGKFFFIAPAVYDEQVIAKKWNADAVSVLTAFSLEVSKITHLTAALAKSTLETVTATLGIGTGKILQALRVSITGSASGPDLMMTMEILGSDEVGRRIQHALNTLKKTV
jgi:glutamyl-tRNA synthetase